MLKKIKTKLTRADLQRPVIDVNAAASEDTALPGASGALVFPVKDEIAKAMADGTQTSEDWRFKGDPNAPAIKELEAQALYEKQQAEAAAWAAQQNLPVFTMGDGALPAPALPQASATAVFQSATKPVENTPDAIAQSAFQPGGQPIPEDFSSVVPGMEAYDMPDMWSKSTAFTDLSNGSAAAAPAPAAVAVPTPVPVVDDQAWAAAVQAAPPVAAPVPPASELPVEGVIYIQHDPAELIKRHHVIPDITKKTELPGATGEAVVAQVGQAGDFPAGGAVTIPHDPAMSALSAQPVAPKPIKPAGPL